MNKSLTALLALAIITLNFGSGAAQLKQQNEVVDTFCAKSARLNLHARLNTNVIEQNLSTELNVMNEVKWEQAWWACKYLLRADSLVLNALKYGLIHYNGLSAEFLRATLEDACCLFPDKLQDEILSVLNTTQEPKIFAMAAVYLISAGAKKITKQDILKILNEKFSERQDDPICTMLRFDISEDDIGNPPLEDLLNSPFWKGKTVILSFQPADRNFQGITVVKKPDGGYCQTGGGQVFSIPHLARSLSNMPGYLTNGNTPYGVLSIKGVSVSDNKFIGRTPFIETTLPFECSPLEFFKDSTLKGLNWTEQMYDEMLPSSWRKDHRLKQSYFAGKAGRSEIVVHGTTIDPLLYSRFPFYPNTPSLGCMTAIELYDDDGRLLRSDQQALIDIYDAVKTGRDYLLVVPFENRGRDLKLSDILSLLK